MIAKDFIKELKKFPNQNAPLTATFSGMFKKKEVCLFSDHDDYRELFINKYAEFPVEESIASVIEALERETDPNAEMIVTYGSEEHDICSTMGGLEIKDNEIFVNTKTCPRQM